MCEHQKFVRKNIVSSAKRTWQHIWGLQSCIWSKVKTSGTMSSETTRPNERLLVIMHRATFDEQQAAYQHKRSADVATEPGQRAVVESTVDSPELVQPTGQWSQTQNGWKRKASPAVVQSLILRRCAETFSELKRTQTPQQHQRVTNKDSWLLNVLLRAPESCAEVSLRSLRHPC